MKILKKGIIGLIIALTISLSFGCQYNDSNTGDDDSHQYDNQTVTYIDAIDVNEETNRSDMVEQYMQATATVYVNTSMGSGIAVHAGGYIATNYHCIADAIDNPDTTIEIEILVENEYAIFSAELLWYNITFDLAIIRSEYYNIPYVKMADRWIDSATPLRIAEEIWTLGTPYDPSLRNTYSTGTISNSSIDKRNSISSGRVYESLIQHSSAISPGSSGSGLFDADGNLLGLNTLGVISSGAESLFFSTPIYPIIYIIPQIAQLNEDDDISTNYSFPTLDITEYDKIMAVYNDDSYSEDGVLIQEVTLGGQSFGELFENDIITGISTESSNIGGDDYYAVNIRNDLLYALSNFSAGDTIKVYYTSGLTSNFATVTLG
ncbi:MAG: serine protease [Clostridia bacterium]|nr:serine protease [Clostridia bacterium]